MIDPNMAVATGNAPIAGEGNQIERDDMDDLDKDAFFKLLTTQLSYQDPLDPMDNTEFVSQMAQFSSLEQMENMNSTMEQFLKTQSLAETAGLIGKTVETVDSETGQQFLGEVNRVERDENGNIYLHLITDEIGETEKYPLDAITSIYS